MEAVEFHSRQRSGPAEGARAARAARLRVGSREDYKIRYHVPGLNANDALE